MNMLLSLAIHTSLNAPFILTGVIALPVEVDTAAYLTALDDELRVLINRHGQTETLQYRILPDQQIESLPAVPITTATVTTCNANVYISGSDHSGQPQVGKLNANGKLLWQFSLKGVTPIRWPAPMCASIPMLVWQTNAKQVEIADINQARLASHSTHEVAELPVAIAADDQAIWIASADSNGINIDKLVGMLKKPIHINTSYPSDISMGHCCDGIQLVWNHGYSSFTSYIDTEKLLATVPKELRRQSRTTGKPRVVPGNYPIIWIQSIDYIENESAHWQSMLIVGETEPLVIDGIIHDIAQWGDQLAVLGSRELYLLDRAR